MTLPTIQEYSEPSKRRFDTITDDEIAKALWATKGLQAHAAIRLDCAPSLVSGRIKESPYLQQVRADAREVRKDDCERALDKFIANEDTTSTIFALKTLCRDRGYAQDTVVVDIKDPVKMLMDQIRSSKNLLEHEKRE